MLNVYRLTNEDLRWGEHILLVAAENITQAETFIPEHRKHQRYDIEIVMGLHYEGGAGIIEDFYWEE